jgi:hypothetical protein
LTNVNYSTTAANEKTGKEAKGSGALPR